MTPPPPSLLDDEANRLALTKVWLLFNCTCPPGPCVHSRALTALCDSLIAMHSNYLLRQFRQLAEQKEQERNP